MSNKANQEYLNSIRSEYQKVNRREKSILLAHAQFVTRLSRKRLIRMLNTEPELSSVSRKSGRRVQYGPELLRHVKAIWLMMEQPCGKKLKVLIPVLLMGYRKRNPDLSEELSQKLLSMSAATLDRFLKEIRVQRGLCTTKAPTSSWYKTAIPVQAKDWNITEPGFVQADTVSHCGESGSGAFVSTLTVTDLHSHWTETRGTWTKHHRQIVRALADIERTLPFALKTIKFDSGSEFMNYAVINYCRQTALKHRSHSLEVLRSRPYRKNDNCYVEQKNLTHVRQFIGYERIESQKSAEILNDLYRNYWCPFLNFFMPTFKLLRKERVGSKIKKKHEHPKTPYERLLESTAVSEEQKQRLKERYESLDPFELKLQIEEKLKLLFEAIRSEEKPGEQLKQVA